MAHYRYLTAVADIPEERIEAGDTVEIPVGLSDPIVICRGYGFRRSEFRRYEEVGLLKPIGGVFGLAKKGGPDAPA